MISECHILKLLYFSSLNLIVKFKYQNEQEKSACTKMNLIPKLRGQILYYPIYLVMDMTLIHWYGTFTGGRGV